ncbi:MAG: pantoate--beta-alanine ligase [Lentisphaerae bacterium]|nr:pantoate--beta-alanine ligase [Lentisphaerota bacterium]
MKVVKYADAMQLLAQEIRKSGKRIGFVPTMGYLHDGHMSLVHMAETRADICVVSIFVNPTQFGPEEDLQSYPRDFERDLNICKKANVDIVFSPDAAQMYAVDHSTHVEECMLSEGLCGLSRPRHFRGVATVVAKLFNIIQPHIAIFGRKDGQQAAVIKRMVRDLNFPVEIVVAPTVREPDGLAMSSRNSYLSDQERTEAISLYRALLLAENMYHSGETNISVVRKAMNDLLGSYLLVRIEYIEFVDSENLRAVSELRSGVMVAIAARVGRTRLIDNTVIA